ncbi:MAG: enoyl-CoA hydratase/isomerase family protein, partial [Chloroflexi bacterium]|nr:enoyl-CoA hydratase/isomerase family protein [Chloroflexota bacterium]
EMNAGVQEHVSACNADPAIGAIVITGAGRGFSSGADLRARSQAAEAGQPAPTPQRAEPLESIPTLFTRSKPLVAAVNGAAVGLGLTMTLSCDVRIASELARFSARFVRIGFTPELASSFLLPQIVGLGNAMELIMSGKIIDAEHAYRIGLVSRVVPHEKLMEEALAVAQEIAFNPTQQLRWAKQLVYANVVNSDIRAVQLAESVIFSTASQSPAAREAARAFLEKREPNFHEED